MIAAAVVATAVSVAAGCRSDNAKFSIFEGVWQAHGRTLTVGRTGKAAESITLGLGHPYIALRLRISHPRGTRDDATATATVTAVTIGSAFSGSRPPRIGDIARIRLHAGVITEGVTGARYCGRAAGDWLKAGCGV